MLKKAVREAMDQFGDGAYELLAFSSKKWHKSKEKLSFKPSLRARGCWLECPSTSRMASSTQLAEADGAQGVFKRRDQGPGGP